MEGRGDREDRIYIGDKIITIGIWIFLRNWEFFADLVYYQINKQELALEGRILGARRLVALTWIRYYIRPELLRSFITMVYSLSK